MQVTTNGPVCVQYIDPPNWSWLVPLISKLSLADLTAIPRVAPVASPLPWMMLMNMTSMDLAAARNELAVRNGRSDAHIFNLITQMQALQSHDLPALIGNQLSSRLISRLDGKLSLIGCITDPGTRDELCPAPVPLSWIPTTTNAVTSVP